MDRQTKRFLEFGSFRIDTGERRLMRGGEDISLTPKVFDLLLLLVENSGHTLSKDYLLERIWTGTVVEENSLTRNVSILRKLIGDGDGNGHYVRTVPKRGYRFEADVRVVLEDEEELVVEKRTNYSLTLRDERSNGAASKVRTFPLDIVSRPLAAKIGVAVVAVALLSIGVAWSLNLAAKGEGPGRNAVVDNGSRPANAEALELFARGRELWQTRSATDLHEATLLLEQAVEKDPGFALAHAALADAYAFDVGNWKKAESAAARAIELDPSLGQPHASIGFVKFFWEWDPAGAEASFKKAVTLSPEYATAHQWYAIRLAANREFNEALSEMQRALQLEPASVAINADMCQMLYFLRRYDEAEEQCRRTLEMDPSSFNARRYLYQVYTARGMYDQAVDEYFKSERLTVNHSALPAHLEKLRTAFEKGGIRGFWQQQIEILNGPVPDTGYTTAWYYSLLGDNERAILCLQRAYEKRDFGLVMLGAEPDFAGIRGDPRFIELYSRLFDR